jgi:hypothetical protein
MYTLINTVESKVIAELGSISELCDKITQVAQENEDFQFSILGESDAFEYLNDFCDDLILLEDSDVQSILSEHGIEVQDIETLHFVELMMDDHKCIEWKGKQYYISDSLHFYSETEEKTYDALVENLHVK